MSWTLSAFADEAGPASDVQVKAIKRTGLNYIDLRMVDGVNISQLPLDQAHAVAEKLRAAEIKVGMFGSPLGKIDITADMAEDEGKLRHLGKMAEVFGCNRVRVFSYFNETGQSASQWEKVSLSRLSQLKDMAGEMGLVLYHENERDIFGDRVEQVLAILHHLRDAGGQGVFRAIFDFDNYNQSGEDVWEAWLKLRDLTDGFHLKESDADKQHVPMGQGATHTKRIFEDAMARGWQGHLALEPHLMHSEAVMATGPGGVANQAFANMSTEDAFHAAAEIAQALLRDVGAPVA